MAGFRPNSEIIGKLKKFYGHFVKNDAYRRIFGA